MPAGARYPVMSIRDMETVIFRPLPLPPTKNEKTTVGNFFNFCESVAYLLLHFIILRGQKPSFITITLPTSLELVVPNYSVFPFLDIRSRVQSRTVLSFDRVTSSDLVPSMTLIYLFLFIAPLAVAPTLISPLLFSLSPYLAPGRCFRTYVLITYQFY